jgi:ESS family glutamate:Na+ symporter
VEIYLDMYQTITVAVLVLMLGKVLKKKFGILERFCIPAPVIGGVVFAVFTCICYVTGIAEFSFDDILKEVCMVFFFTSVGFQANLKVLKSGGKALIIFLGLVIGLILSQNFLAVGLAKLLHISPLVGLCTGSIPMVGGHGTAGIWPGAGGFWYYGCNNALYGRCNIWSDYGKYYGWTGRQASD